MERKILLVGIGQTGCGIVEKLSQKLNTHGIFFRSLAIDTDENMLESIEYSERISLAEKDSLGTVAEKIGVENIESFFPCNWEEDGSAFAKRLDMSRGANQWRMKALLSFVSFLSNAEKVQALNDILSQLGEGCEMYVAASLAGGTGSALFLPVTLYIKQYIKSIGGEISYANAVLTLPDIYDGCYSLQQSTKSYANAYAALRELNTVNVTCIGETGSEYIAEHPPVSFKIGDEKSHTLLFDSENENYQSSDNAPFNRVVLYNRIAGMTSVEAHTSAIAQMLASYCIYESEEITNKANPESSSIYGGVSLTRVVYPIESIVDYITKKQLATLVSDEICSVHSRATLASEANMLQSRSYGSDSSNATASYCSEYISVINKMTEDSEQTDTFMGRKLSVAHNYPDASYILDNEFFKDLEAQVYASFENKTTRELNDIINPPQTEEDDPRPKKPNVFEQKKRFEENVERARSLIISFYRNNVKGMEETNKKMSDTLLGTGECDGYSIFENVIKYDGEYLHPVYAMARLCVLYTTLEKQIFAASAYKIPDPDEVRENVDSQKKIKYVEIIPECLLSLKTVSSRSGYSKHGRNRFCVYINGEKTEDNEVTIDNPPVFKNMFNDKSLYRDDLEEIYKRLRLMLVGMRYSALLEAVGAVIEKYRSFFGSLCKIEPEILQDSRLALIRNAKDNGNTVNVASSEAEKEKAYRDYLAQYFQNKPEVMADDALVGEIAARLVGTSLEECICPEQIFAATADTEGVYKTRLLGTDFYKTTMEKNIFEAMMHTTGKQNRPEDIGDSRFFMGRGIPLKCSAPESDKDRRSAREATVAMLPRSVERYIEENVSLSDGMTPKSFVEKLLYSAGEYYGEVYFSENICDREMYVRKEISNIPLYMAELVDENGNDCTAYAAYVKACDNATSYMTPMWNPSLIYKREPSLLPFISADKQIAYERDVAKAVIYGMLSEKIIVRKSEDSAASVYYLIDGKKITSIYQNGAEISEGDICGLMHWQYCRVNQTCEFSKGFDAIISQLIADVPVKNTSFTSYGVISASVKRKSIFLSLCETVLALLGALCDRDALTECGYARNIALALDCALKEYCICADGDFNEISIGIYNDLASAFKEKIRAELAQKKSDRILSLCDDLSVFSQLIPSQE